MGNDKVQLFSSTLPDSPPDSGSENLLSPQSTTNTTYPMTPNQIDMSGYNNQYIDSSPGTEYSTLSVSPPNSGIQNVILDNEVMMYPSKIAHGGAFIIFRQLIL